MTIIADGHVHLHLCFQFKNVFNAAIENFYKWNNNNLENIYRILFLTEGENEDSFNILTNLAGLNKELGDWKLKKTNEFSSLYAENHQGQNLFIIAGRQIIAAEGVEVLALGTTNDFKDRLPMNDLIDKIRNSGGLPVIPWGFGKWIGYRRSLVNIYLERYGNKKPLFLGDNGNRLKYLPRPKQFYRGEEKGIRVLPGSDPLPFPSEQSRIGSFGFMIKGQLNPEQPTTSLYRLLVQPNLQIKHFGNLERPLRFFRKQIAMQWRKRLNR
jgi:hypothetical protein